MNDIGLFYYINIWRVDLRMVREMVNGDEMD